MATGPGIVARAARARGARTVGVDFSRSMAALARSVTDVVVGDVDALPFAKASFDVALCNFGLLHFGSPERALGEIARVLAPGGRAALSVWAGPDTNLFFGAVYRAIEKNAPRRPDVPPAPAFFHFADEARFRGLLAGAGLGDVAIERVGWKARVASARSMVDLFLEGSVRTAAILRAQDASTLERITASIEQEIAPCAGAVPVAALVARGRKG